MGVKTLIGASASYTKWLFQATNTPDTITVTNAELIAAIPPGPFRDELTKAVATNEEALDLLFLNPKLRVSQEPAFVSASDWWWCSDAAAVGGKADLIWHSPNLVAPRAIYLTIEWIHSMVR